MVVLGCSSKKDEQPFLDAPKGPGTFYRAKLSKQLKGSMENISDDLLARVAQGDSKAFEEVYKASSGFVYNVAFRVVNNTEDAREVTQEVFLIIYNKLKSFRFESSFKTWVYRITANYAINYAKKYARAKTVPFDEDLCVGASPSEAESKIDKEHQSRIVEELLGEINPDQRACVVLRNIEGLSYEAIAQALNININTVRSRLKRAREKLLTLKKRKDFI
jgi:RNA polymerase sigma-70 factor (ECF subfamily)